jgi:tetratricopeptide (TPR) repeat protein
MLRNRSPLHAGLLAAALLLPLALAGCRSTGSVAGGADSSDRLTKPSAEGWHEDFPREANVKSVGQYRSVSATMELESFSALLLEPSPTADFAIDQMQQARVAAGLVSDNRGPHQLAVRDTQPALKPNTNPDRSRFYERADGAISALGWVNEQFRDVRVTGEVNTQGGAEGKGSVSRQGVMARWDLGNNFYWFAVDFASGSYEIVRAKYFGVFAPLPGSIGKVRDFKSTSAYVMEFELVGDTLQGRVFEPSRKGKRGRMVADTGKVRDSEPWYEGVSGFLAEPAIEAPFAPLEASFGTLTSEAVGGSRPTAQTEPRIAGVADAAQARFQRARALARQGDAEQAVLQLNEALKAAPDYIEAQSELAWIRATSEDPKLRDPRQAVELAEKAVGGIVELYDRRRQLPANSPGGERFTKNFLIRAGITLAAAYASAGRFDSAPTPGVTEQLLNISNVAGLSRQDLQSAMADCGGMAAVEAATWAVTFAQQEALRAQSPESRQLLQTGQEMLASFKAKRAVTGKVLP